MSNTSGWKDELQSLINDNVSIRVNGKVASGKTQSDRAKYLFKFMNDLRKGGFKVSPRNVKLKHIEYICQKLEADMLSAATIQTYLTHLRVFSRWIGKNGLLDDVDLLFNNPKATKRHYAATEDRSWTAQGVDVKQALLGVKASNTYVWHQLLMQQAFGLRCKEAILFVPYLNVKDKQIYITRGAKGGKTRVIPLETELQSEVINLVIQFVGQTTRSLADPELTLKQNLKKYANVMAKHQLTKRGMGVTGHWLRVEYIINYSKSQGLTPIVCGGEAGQLSKDEENRVKLGAAQRLGHNRTSVTTAYYGGFSKK